MGLLALFQAADDGIFRLINRTLENPLFDRLMPILSDKWVAFALAAGLLALVSVRGDRRAWLLVGVAIASVALSDATGKDGVRALYCIFRYNSDYLPLPIQFLIYLLIGGTAAVVNLSSFLAMLGLGVSLTASTVSAFAAAAAVNYTLCVALLFRHKARWNSATEILIYLLVVATGGILDLGITRTLYVIGLAPWLAKSVASVSGLMLNCLGRRFVVFPFEPTSTRTIGTIAALPCPGGGGPGAAAGSKLAWPDSTRRTH